MTHMIAWYPDSETSLNVAKGLVDGGASYIELQFPFSDPTADGPVIQAACSKALEAGFTLNGGFELAAKISALSDVPVFIMTYANPVVVIGIEAFIQRAKDAGVRGLIVPDLVAGSDDGLYAAGKKLDMPIVPVVVPTVSEQRLNEISALGEPWVYTALRQGITGRQTEISEELIAFLEKLKKTEMDIFAGFGIRTEEQIALLEAHVHAPVVGSALVNLIAQTVDGNADRVYKEIRDFTRRLCKNEEE